MIIVLKPNCTDEQVKHFADNLTKEYNVKVNTWVGTQSTVLGLLGDTTSIDIDYISAQDFVESVKRVQEPYKKANRKFHPDNTVITLPTGQKIGDGSLADVYKRQGCKSGLCSKQPWKIHGAPRPFPPLPPSSGGRGWSLYQTDRF